MYKKTMHTLEWTCSYSPQKAGTFSVSGPRGSRPQGRPRYQTLAPGPVTQTNTHTPVTAAFSLYIFLHVDHTSEPGVEGQDGSEVEGGAGDKGYDK